ncbi:hypothetical protein DPMN_099918 [Dreissena polymorpha]|uniref:Uncharacterized protein n=1 Tax=Dreissena polymorpha TaxID=45954 RepID=A0A9D4R854_DREPO|nr:hypothetical protein DPMN_099918 [Dreissena polymorpha]
MASFVIFLVFIFCLPIVYLDNVDDYLKAVLHSVDKIVNFYQSDYKNLNVDGLFGVRVLEGHLAAIIKDYESGKLQHLNQSQVDQMRRLKKTATTICDQALEHVRKDGEKYFSLMGMVLRTPWDNFDTSFKKVNLTLEWTQAEYDRAKREVHMDESVSDRCMSELMGSHKPRGQPCDISQQCALDMTAPGLLGYGITHQLLWTMLAEKVGCSKKLSEGLMMLRQRSLVSLRQEMCTNNFLQMQNMRAKFPGGVLPPAFQDLLLEQLFVCPSLGYHEFLQLEFLPQVLSWQHSNGCYGKMPRMKYKSEIDEKMREMMGDIDEDYIDSQEKVLPPEYLRKKNPLVKNMNIPQQGHDYLNMPLPGHNEAAKVGVGLKMDHHRQGRKLLVEKTMTGNCLAHKTAVASGALVLYLRYLTLEHSPLTLTLRRSQRSASLLSNKVVALSTSYSLIASTSTFLPLTRAVNISNKVQFRGSMEGKKGGKGGILDYTKVGGDIAGKQGVKGDNAKVKGELVGKQEGGIDPIDIKAGLSELNNKRWDDNYLPHGGVGDDGVGNDDSFHNVIKAPQNLVVQGYSKDRVNKVNNTLGRNIDSNVDDAIHRNMRNKVGSDLGNKEDENYADDGDVNEDDDYDDDKEEEKDDNKMDDAYYARVKEGHAVKRDDEGAKIEDHARNNDNDNDEEYNAEYDDHDKENVHGHINGRNLGKNGGADHDKDLDEKSDAAGLHPVKDYNDEEEDDYEYDDDNKEMERRREEEIRHEFILGKSGQDKNAELNQRLPSDIVKSQHDTISMSTMAGISVVCIVILYIFYRILSRRRLRFKPSHKFFHA